MIHSSEEQIKKFIDFLSATVPFHLPPFGDLTYLSWHNVLSKFSTDELTWYLKYAAENLKSFPPVCEINNSIMDRRNGFLSVDPIEALMNGCKNKESITAPINDLSAKFGGWSIVGQWQTDQWEMKRRSIETAWLDVKKKYQIKVEKKSQNSLQQLPNSEPFTPRTEEEIEKVRKLFAKIRDSLAKDKTLRT